MENKSYQIVLEPLICLYKNSNDDLHKSSSIFHKFPDFLMFETKRIIRSLKIISLILVETLLNVSDMQIHRSLKDPK